MGTALVDTARRALGPVGAILPVSFTSMPPVDRQREAASRLEQAGYRAAWTNEVIGKDALVQLAVLLASTERMVFAAGADHVILMVAPGGEFAVGVSQLESVGPALADIA
jgi:hypothetical protein